MTSNSMTRGTATGNLHAVGFDVPDTAICESDAAPAQNQSLRASVSTTSCPTRDSMLPANTPADWVRAITYLPAFLFAI